MLLGTISIVLLCSWILIELFDWSRTYRIVVGVLAVAFTVASVIVASCVSSQFNKTFEINNAVKNLTAGLVTITSSEYDQNMLHERIRRLDSEVIPTYEEHSSAKQAISSFLEKYGVRYQEEMPLERHGSVLEIQVANEIQ